MPKIINWDGVWQSITDTWMPLIIAGSAFILIVVIVLIIRHKSNK